MGLTLRVVVTASNTGGEASAESSPTSTVLPPPPVSTAPPAISGIPKTGQTLTASTGSWTSLPPFSISYGYQWQRCSGESCTDIAGATSATYVLSAEDSDGTVRVVVTATNAPGISASSDSATRFIPRSVRVTEYTYDADGNLASQTDGNGHTTKYTYDADDNQVKVTEPDGTGTETEYNPEGEVIAQTDGNKHTTKYTRNVLGQITEVTEPLGHKTIKQYDPSGNLTSLTDSAGRTTSYTYDAANQPTEATYSDGKTPTVKYEYDADGNRTKMVDGTGTTTYDYDQLDRLTEVTDGHGDTVGYEYNLADEQTKLTYPSGKAVERSYDTDGRLNSVSDWLGKTTAFSYDADSNLTGITFPSDTEDNDTYGYNDASEVNGIEMKKGSEQLASLTYNRDNDGEVTKTVSKGLPGAETIEYSYDDNNRLTEAEGNSYAYDAANDPTTTPGSTNTYNEADELGSSTGASYTYNEVGQRTKTTPTSGPATSYGYDQAGNLTSVERPAAGETTAIDDTYGYNGDGLRTSQTAGETTNYLTWDTSGELPLILNDGTSSYIYGPDGLPVEQVSSEGNILYLHHDQQGSTRLLTGSTGTTEGAYTFDAYGNQTGHTGTATTPLGYDGQYTSTHTGLIYLRARTYDPTTAQFLSVDPLKAVTREPYGYAGQDPLNDEDRSGLGLETDLEGGGGIPCPWCSTWEESAKEVLRPGAEAIEHGLERLGGTIFETEEPTDEGESVLRENRERSEEECGKELAREGEQILGGRSERHSKAAGERWQEWYDKLGRGDKRLYRKANGPRRRSRG